MNFHRKIVGPYFFSSLSSSFIGRTNSEEAMGYFGEIIRTVVNRTKEVSSSNKTFHYAQGLDGPIKLENLPSVVARLASIVEQLLNELELVKKENDRLKTVTQRIHCANGNNQEEESFRSFNNNIKNHGENSGLVFTKKESFKINSIQEVMVKKVLLHFETKQLKSQMGIINKSFLNVASEIIGNRTSENHSKVIWNFNVSDPKIILFSNKIATGIRSLKFNGGSVDLFSKEISKAVSNITRRCRSIKNPEICSDKSLFESGLVQLEVLMYRILKQCPELSVIKFSFTVFFLNDEINVLKRTSKRVFSFSKKLMKISYNEINTIFVTNHH